MNDDTKRIYYAKVVFNMRRAQLEAEKSSHLFANAPIQMRHPKDTSQLLRVMSLPNAIRWCVEFHVPTWSSSTWRMCRAGYLMLLNASKQQGRMSQEEYDQLHAILFDAKGLKKSERERKTSARRKKNVTAEQIQAIESYVSKKPSLTWGAALVIWLKASVATGLRPNEWRTASLREEDGRLLLTSPNFKHNEIRSFGPTREIDITGLEPDWQLNVKKQIAIIQAIKDDSETSLDEHYRGCSALLLSINKRLWPRRKFNVNLYTGRHQFSANAKASDSCSEVERAAMMGHKTTKTSRERYGRKGNGSKGLTPDVGDRSVLPRIESPEINRKNPVQTPK